MMVKKSLMGCVGLGLFLGLAQAAQAQSMAQSLGVVAYPPEDKTPQQISDDEAHCYNWAVGNSGVDPLAAANQQAQQQPEQQRGGQVAGGAAAGAAAGVLIGDTGKSAATGAAIGAVGGGIHRRRGERQQHEQQAQVQEQGQSDMDFFRMNFGACLNSRGYSVN
jgi:hypothetical protein